MQAGLNLVQRQDLDRPGLGRLLILGKSQAGGRNPEEYQLIQAHDSRASK
jgi:hypothetical protein